MAIGRGAANNEFNVEITDGGNVQESGPGAATGGDGAAPEALTWMS